MTRGYALRSKRVSQTPPAIAVGDGGTIETSPTKHRQKLSSLWPFMQAGTTSSGRAAKDPAVFIGQVVVRSAAPTADLDVKSSNRFRGLVGRAGGVMQHDAVNCSGVSRRIWSVRVSGECQREVDNLIVLRQLVPP